MAFEPRLPASESRKAHEHYDELCALFTSGSLTDDELSELNAHVRVCAGCATLLSSYQVIAKSGISLLAPLRTDAEPAQKPTWIENAKKRLLNSIDA